MRLQPSSFHQLRPRTSTFEKMLWVCGILLAWWAMSMISSMDDFVAHKHYWQVSPVAGNAKVPFGGSK